jgi:transposase
MVCVIWLVLTTGSRWEDAPNHLGRPGRTAHRRLRVWVEVGIWDRLHPDLRRLPRQAGKLDADLAAIDDA